MELLENQFDQALAKLKRNKELRESGKQICIPFPFPRLAKVLPGIEKGMHIGLTAGTGISKSKFSRFVFVYSVYRYIKENPNCGIKPKIFLFLLEDPLTRVMNNIICHRLKVEYKVDILLKDLESKDEVLSDEVLGYIAECKDYFKDLTKYLTIIDHIHNPFGIYKEVRDYLEKNGTIETEEHATETGEINKIPKKYIPNDPEEHVIVILDNLNQMSQEQKHKGAWDAMGEWTSKYARRLLCKFYGATVITIQQQDLESQKLSYSMYQGDAIKNKVKPSIASLGDNKTVSRDYHLVFGLFSPDRFEFEEDLGYDITLLQNNYRNLSVLKSNESDTGYEVGLYFNGASEQFIELPHPKMEVQKLLDFYDKLKKKYKK